MASKNSAKTSFDWEGKDGRGHKVKGQINAVNADLAKAQLRRQGITPLRVRKKAAPLFGSGKKKITSKDISIFARQMSTMMTAGVPLVQSFEIVGQGHDNPAMQELIFNIKNDIESGSTMGTALSKHPKQFDNLFCSLVSAGEQSGTLESLLTKIATYKEKTEALKAKIKKALFYPVAVLVVAFVVTAILLVFVVPEFQKLFEGMGGELPAFTQFVMQLSEGFQKWWWLIVLVIVGSLKLFGYLRLNNKAFSDMIDRLLLRLPVVGDMLEKAAIARFARTLATMSTAGVPLVEAMESVATTSGNSVYYNAIMQMKDDAASGQQLQVSMQQTGLFPNMVVQMVAIGEESGALDSMLAKVADLYEEEVDNAVDALTSLLEPLIMSFLGVVVGGLVIAMYLPIFKMGDAF
ncbi:MAG: type II secretion system F family protein [Gammaproteobacteria bacterium]|nr:type II secretion system F family protein [Gammaproteobacteria bacterium]